MAGVTIRFTRRVAVVKNHLEENEETTKDPKVLKKIHSKRRFLKRSYSPDRAFTNFIEDPSELASTLVKVLKPGGWIDLHFDEQQGVLFGVTEYRSERKLKARELSYLAEYTLAQWSDGGGAAAMDQFSEEIEPYYVDLCPFEIRGRLKSEQI